MFLCLRPFHLSAVESSLRILVAIDQVLWYVDLLGVLQAKEKLIHQNKDHLLISTYTVVSDMKGKHVFSIDDDDDDDDGDSISINFSTN